MPQLHLYDFDGTLFRSPDRPDWWGNVSSIVDNSSLGRPCVPDKPGSDWWNGWVVNDAKKSIGDSEVWAIVCTGRAQTAGGFRFRIPELLKGKGLSFDEVYLNPGMDTEKFKKDVITRLLRMYPDIDEVHIWEDHPGHLPKFIKHIENLGRVGVPHFSRSTPHETSCSLEQMEALVEQGQSKWRARAANVAAMWIRRQSLQ